MSYCVNFYFEWTRVELIDVISCNIFCLTSSEVVCADLILLIYVYMKKGIYMPYDPVLFCGETRKINLKFSLKLDASLHLLEIKDILGKLQTHKKSHGIDEELWVQISKLDRVYAARNMEDFGRKSVSYVIACEYSVPICISLLELKAEHLPLMK